MPQNTKMHVSPGEITRYSLEDGGANTKAAAGGGVLRKRGKTKRGGPNTLSQLDHFIEKTRGAKVTDWVRTRETKPGVERGEEASSVCSHRWLEGGLRGQKTAQPRSQIRGDQSHAVSVALHRVPTVSTSIVAISPPRPNSPPGGYIRRRVSVRPSSVVLCTYPPVSLE